MYNGINAYGGANDPKGLAFGLYFVLLVIIGNCILLSINNDYIDLDIFLRT